MKAVKQTLDTFLKWASILLFAALVVIVAWQVITRSLGDPSTWAEEAARYSFVWLAMIASALVFSEKGHIAVDFLVRKQPPAGQKTTAVIAQLSIMALAILVFIWGGIRASSRAWSQQLSSLPFSVGMMYIVIPIAGVLILFYSILHTAQILRGEEAPYPEDEEAVIAAEAPRTDLPPVDEVDDGEGSPDDSTSAETGEPEAPARRATTQDKE